MRRDTLMATTKIHPIKTTINASVNYILDKDKTMDSTLVSTYGCDKDTVISDFNAILSNSKSTNRTVSGQHLIQSFKPGEVDMETAHEIGIQLADKFLKGRHQYVIATHVDKDHIHNHIIINQVSFVDFKSFKSKRSNVYEIREISDQLCRDYGLSVIRNQDINKKRKDPKYSRTEYKNSFRTELKNDIDNAIRMALNYSDFIRIMEENYYVKQHGKYTTFKNKNNGQVRPIRMERLGAAYGKTIINHRINNEFLDIKKHNFKPLKNDWVKEVIDLTSSVKFTTKPELRYWAIRQNNQSIVETLNRMNQLGCGSYNQLTVYVTQLEALCKQDDTDIREINADINALKSLLFKAENVRERINLYHQMELLSEEEQVEFIAKHNISDSDLAIYEEFKNELQSEGYFVGSASDLNTLTIKINEKLELKRSEVLTLLKDQQAELTLINEMKHLANNYDVFLGKTPSYDIQKNGYIQR